MLLLLSLAFAQDPAPTGTPTAETPAAGGTSTEAAAPASKGPRKSIMEVGVRARYLTVPGGIIDPFVFNHKGGGIMERPKINAYSFGLEYVIRNKSANLFFYAEYALSAIPEGYWDDVEEPANFDDGSWLKPERLGMFTTGVNGAHEVYVRPWWSFLFGGGLGIAVITGQMTEWEPGEGPGSPEMDNTDPNCGIAEPAYLRKDTCPNDGPMGFPSVLPMVDVNVSTRFHIGDRATIRLEGGLHDMFYGGMTVGVMF